MIIISSDSAVTGRGPGNESSSCQPVSRSEPGTARNASTATPGQRQRRPGAGGPGGPCESEVDHDRFNEADPAVPAPLRTGDCNRQPLTLDIIESRCSDESLSRSELVVNFAGGCAGPADQPRR
jgi:hypothetical protein